MGLKQNSHVLHVIDMGLMKKYYDDKLKKHIKHKTGKSLVGTARYTSVHSHNGEELSRRDDFQAIAYVIIY